MKFASASDIGLVRAENQDKVHVSEINGNILAVLCDGMGGENSGREASEIAVNTVVDTFHSLYEPEADIKRLLFLSLFAANAAVYEEAADNPEKSGMGTTCVAAFVTDKLIHIVNVGDSRAYIYDNKEIKKITDDHTAVNMLVSNGKITAEEAKFHPYRNMLMKAVGVEPSVSPDYFRLEVPESFRLLLCSDGLSGFCSSEEIENVLQNNSFECLSDEFIRLAISKGGRDNVTVAVIAE